MSQEVFEIVQGMDLKAIETQLALQCAPLITGLKTSNLLIVQNEKVRQVRMLLRKTELAYFILFRGTEKTTILLFRHEPLSRYLQEPEVQKLLSKLGYDTRTFGKQVAVFAERYSNYMAGNGEFPHEMGVFLGYPVEDVKGFMENEGKNFLFSGYWKVYQDEAVKKDLFKKFDLAKETLIQLVANGVSMHDVIDLYSGASYC